MAAPPDVDNLSLFKGIIKFAPAGGSTYADLGECLSFATSITVDPLPYNSRRHSSRIPVKTVILGKTMTVAITMSEFDLTNLALWSMGEVTGTAPSESLDIGTVAEVRGALRFIGTNEVGTTFQIDLPDVLIGPTGDLEWLADADWSQMQLTGAVNADPTTGSFGTIRPIAAGAEITTP